MIPQKRFLVIENQGLINSKLKHPPPPQAIHGYKTVVRAPRVENLNLAWIKWGILYRNTSVTSLNMEVFKGEEFIFANEWLRRTCPQGLGPSLKLGQ